MANLLKSRKFLLLVLDVVVSAALYFVAKYAGQSIYDDVHLLIGLLQPVFVAVIGSIAYEDGADAKAAGVVLAAGGDPAKLP